MKVPFTSHLGTKLMALVLGVVLWAFAYIENIQEVKLQYRVSIKAPQGWGISDAETSPIIVTVRGPRRIIEELRANNAASNPGFVKTIPPEAFDGQGETATLPVALSAEDLPGLDSRVTVFEMPAPLKAEFFREVTRDLPVELKLLGEPAPGYAVGDKQWIYPATVKVRGPKSLLERPDAVVTTSPIPVTDRSATVEMQNVRIENSISGTPVQLVGSQSVMVSIPIVEKPVTRTITVEARALFPSGYPYKVALDPATVGVTIEGNDFDVSAVGPNDITVWVQIDRAWAPRETPQLGQAQAHVNRQRVAVKSIDPSSSIGVLVTAQ